MNNLFLKRTVATILILVVTLYLLYTALPYLISMVASGLYVVLVLLFIVLYIYGAIKLVRSIK